MTVQVEERVHTALTLLAEVDDMSLQGVVEGALSGFVDDRLADPQVRGRVQEQIDRKVEALRGY